MKIITILAFCFCLILIAYSQEEPNHLKPILLDKAALSGEGLKLVPLKNEPTRTFFQKNLYRGKDLSVYIVSSQSWKGSMDNFSIDEYVFILNGKSRAKPENGENQYFQTGEHFAIPKGYTGEWEVMAGDNFHYELSVITTQRASEAKISKSLKPQALDKDKLSGMGIQLDENGFYEESLFKGDELHMSVQAEKPRRVDMEIPAKEQLISVLSGAIKITDTHGQTYDFYTGDYFLIPSGFIGSWESKGHGLLKYLSIEKA